MTTEASSGDAGQVWSGADDGDGSGVAGGDSPESLRWFVIRDGHGLVARGDGGRLVRLVRAARIAGDPGVDAVLGDALWSTGDWDGALEAFERVERASLGGPLPAAVAWRFGALLYLRSETGRAEALLRRADLEGSQPPDEALVSAWLAAAVWRRGDVDAADRLTERAIELADSCGDSRAVAAAKVARALICAARGDRQGNARAYRAALRAATAAGDAVQVARIHSNLASRSVEQGDYEAAVASANRAVEAASAHEFLIGVALANKAEALLRLGHLDLAHAAGQESADAVGPAGSVNAGPAYLLLGEVYRQRGDRVQARWCLERGLRAAHESADVHVLVAAHIGMVWVVGADDPALADHHAQRALEPSTGLERAAALNAVAWARLCADDLAAAGTAARDAEAEARRTDDRYSLATSLELRAAAARPPDVATLQSAQAVWTAIGDRVSSARVALSIADATGDADGLVTARRQLAELGAAGDVGVAGYLATASTNATRETATITTLGRFSVTVDGRPVASKEWQSRKTRDLLKLLVAQVGRPVSRDAVIEWLWPEVGSDAVAARLSVTLSRLRGVLDPARRHPPDHYLLTDKNSVALRADHLQVDVHAFLTAVTEGARLADEDAWDAAESRLRTAEELYVGDFLDDDRFQDWALACRERARAASMTSTRLLARASARRGADEDTARWLIRLLERDPYDEDAWTALIGAQQRMRRHGEARHLYSQYRRRMHELGIAPAGFESLAERLP